MNLPELAQIQSVIERMSEIKKRKIMDVAPINRAERNERLEAQPYFALTTTIGMIACCCFVVKGVILTVKAHSIMSTVVGLSVTLFSVVLFNSIQKIVEDRIYSRSVEELRNTRGSPVQQVADALCRIGTFGLKGKFFTALREKAQKLSSRPFFSATCFSIICLSTYSTAKGLMLTALALSPSTPVIAIITKLSLPLISGGIILAGLGLMASRYSSLAGIADRAASLGEAAQEIHRTKLSAIISPIVGLGAAAIVMGVGFAAASSFPTAPLALLAARVGLTVMGLTLTVMGLGCLGRVCESFDRSLENLQNIPVIDHVIEVAYILMWPEEAARLPALPCR